MPDSSSDANANADLALLSEEERQVIADIPLDESDSEALAAVTIDVKKLEKRQRQITATITLPYSKEQVWQVLTDYAGLSEFIPNLASSQLLEHPDGGIRLEQVGVQSALFLKFSARVVLDMTEDVLNSIHFEMAEGDFNAFSGDWLLAEVPGGTQLTYRLLIWPKRKMPVIAIERRLRYDLPRNLIAIQQRLEAVSA